MTLDKHLGDLEALERRQALRALLARPLLSAEQAPEDLRAIRRHATALREWFDAQPRWMLVVDAEAARLFKTPPDHLDATRGARDVKHDTPLSRRAYVLFCLAAVALEKRRQERQTTLGELARQLRDLLTTDARLAAVGLDFEQRAHRHDLVSALRLLAHLGVLRRVEGQEEQYVQGGGDRDVLYGIRRPLLTLLLAARRGPSTLAPELPFERRLAAINEEPLTDDAQGRNRRIRSELTRRLLDDPVLYVDALNEDARDYYASQRVHLCRVVGEAAGLTAEVRREGVAMVDEGSPLSDRRMPEEGTDGHATLLLAEHLAAELRAARSNGADGEPDGAEVHVELGRTSLEARMAEFARENSSHWRRASREVGAEVTLCRDAIERLAELGLVRVSGSGVVPLPAIARFARCGAKSEEPSR